ncbi:hypothetical protein AB837_00335 [bacterium AB1]|nr:hypothetical protein AB837_00335 [bacterium AB1]
MLNINKSILNNLIKNYINNKQKYIISANLRDISIDVKKIDQLIEKKSNHEYQINEINQQRNQLSKNANKEDII